MLRKLIMLVVAPAAIIGGAAAPAFAAGPNTVQVTVNTQIVMTGLQNVVFNGLPGTSIVGCGVTDTGCPTNGDPTESYTVQSNSPTGYHLTEQATTDSFLDSTGAAAIPDTDWTIQNNPPGGGAADTFSPSAVSTLVYTGPARPSTDTFTEAWKLNLTSLPNLAAGSYTNSLTYLATAN